MGTEPVTEGHNAGQAGAGHATVANACCNWTPPH